MFGDLFSKRHKPKPDKFRYDLPRLVRSRILNYLKHFHDQSGYFGSILQEVCEWCFLEYGGTSHQPGQRAHWEQSEIDRAVDHFYACNDEMAIDFIEMCFKSRYYIAHQLGVQAINDVLREEGIGFAFSPYVVNSQVLANGDSDDSVAYPQATKKTDEILHSQAVMPALLALSHPRFQSANAELLNAHKHYRGGDFEATVWASGQALESVFKSICTQKKWAYDKDRDALAKLVSICRDNGLFLGFYAPIFENAGTIRNKMGGHGAGPDMVKPSAEHAEHMLHLVSSHILLLVRMAKL